MSSFIPLGEANRGQYGGRAGVRMEMSAKDVRMSEYASFPHVSCDVMQQLSMSPGS